MKKGATLPDLIGGHVCREARGTGSINNLSDLREA